MAGLEPQDLSQSVAGGPGVLDRQLQVSAQKCRRRIRQEDRPLAVDGDRIRGMSLRDQQFAKRFQHLGIAGAQSLLLEREGHCLFELAVRR